MIILGLAGFAGVGKDTVADYLVGHYGFEKFAFSDALYREVCEAFSLESEDLLRDRGTKETPTELLALKHCKDNAFVEVVTQAMDNMHKKVGVGLFLYPVGVPLSPRQVLQWWGTQYRRAQDPNYWVKRTADWLAAIPRLFTYPEHVPQFFVNTTVRFPNERQWVHDMGGNVWHIRRDAAKPVAAHVSETPLEVWSIERELFNNDTVERLHYGINLMMTTAARFVAVEPELREEN